MTRRAETPAALFARAVAAYGHGDAEQASALCAGVLALDPDHGDALHLSGVAAMGRGDAAAALTALRAAAALLPADPQLASNLGSALEATGAPGQALCWYDKALGLRGDFTVAHFNRGNVLRALGRLDEAVAAYDQALALRGDYAEAETNRANTLLQAGAPMAAVEGYDRAVALRPDHAPTHHNRGRALQALGRHDAALASYARAILLAPGDAAVLSDHGMLLRELGYPEAALVDLDRAVALDPGCVEAVLNRGTCLMLLERWDLALAALDRALALDPTQPEAHLNYGNVLLGQDRPEAALACFDRALALRPDYADAWLDRGVALQELLRLDEAVAEFDRALAVRPGWADAGMNKALALALAGRLTEAWACYEARKRRASPSGVRPSPGVLARPAWQGEDVAGRHVFLYWEQGFGDTIQFCRYAPMVRALGATVTLSVQDALVPLLRDAFPGVRVLGGNEEPRDFDVSCPLLDLPRVFGTTAETIPAVPGGYLAADPARVRAWADRLGPARGRRIGLAWSGNPGHVSDYKRSVPLETLAPLLGQGAGWIALQKEVRAGDLAAARGVRLFGEGLTDFAETAALIAQLDLVVSVDTSVAHLAAAMGKPVWLMLSHCPDWRWMVGRGDTPWYPTVRLFRQAAWGDWGSVVGEVAQEFTSKP